MWHGTSREAGQSIQREGLRQIDEHRVNPLRWWTLSSHGDEALHFARKPGSVVEFRVPNEHVDEYTNSLDNGSSTLYALRKNLPAEYVHQVHDV
jgi:hypothetical protein